MGAVRFGTHSITLLGDALLVTVMLLFGLAAWSGGCRVSQSASFGEQRLAESDPITDTFSRPSCGEIGGRAQTGALWMLIGLPAHITVELR
jgi:hypothetical protein